MLANDAHVNLLKIRIKIAHEWSSRLYRRFAIAEDCSKREVKQTLTEGK